MANNSKAYEKIEKGNAIVKFESQSVARMSDLNPSVAKEQFKKLSKKLELEEIKASRLHKPNR